MPCCEFCYEKYLDENGEVIWPLLYELHMKTPNVYLKEGEERPICKCECHIEGSGCLH
jgi:hypothetical protein